MVPAVVVDEGSGGIKDEDAAENGVQSGAIAVLNEIHVRGAWRGVGLHGVSLPFLSAG